MQLILIDHARERKAQRRDSGIQHVPLSPDIPWLEVGSPEILERSSALCSMRAYPAALEAITEALRIDQRYQQADAKDTSAAS